MNDLDAITARVVRAATVPELLDVGFDAFEVIRQVARACEDRAPSLFAAFILAAGAAVEGRNALNDAPSLPHDRCRSALAPAMNLAADVGRGADELAELAALLTQRLREAAAQANLAGDRDACERATRAAAGIYQLLGRDTDAATTG
jgi:hypothetical protein